MSRVPGYPSPQHHPAVVTDRWGRVETTLVEDDGRFTLFLRGNRFEGTSVDSLELVGAPVDSGEPPELRSGDLCSCTVEWRMPVRVSLADAGPASVPLTARLVIGEADPRRVAGSAGSADAADPVGVTLTLHLPGGDVATTTPRDWLEDALTDLRHLLPDGTRLLACISCAFSDYHPAGSGFSGSLACFRDCKDAYRAVTGKSGLFDVWHRNSGFVQETFHCPDFEQREPGAGYRG